VPVSLACGIPLSSPFFSASFPPTFLDPSAPFPPPRVGQEFTFFFSPYFSRTRTRAVTLLDPCLDPLRRVRFRSPSDLRFSAPHRPFLVALSPRNDPFSCCEYLVFSLNRALQGFYLLGVFGFSSFTPPNPLTAFIPLAWFKVKTLLTLPIFHFLSLSTLRSTSFSRHFFFVRALTRITLLPPLTHTAFVPFFLGWLAC